jgi:hypothetical protein
MVRVRLHKGVPVLAKVAQNEGRDRVRGQEAGTWDHRRTVEAVKAEIKTSNVATIAVRLLHKPSGKPVAGAVVVQTRLIMPHEGTSEMTSAIAPLPSPEPGVYAFMAPMTMAGRWVLSITARVQNESETVTGTITFRAAQ